MDAYDLAKALVKVDELINSGNIIKAEQFLISIEEELVKDGSSEELNRLTIFWNKIEKHKTSKTNFSSSEETENELLSRMLKGQKIQNETLKSIEGYLKFFFWLAIIGLILIVISWLL